MVFAVSLANTLQDVTVRRKHKLSTLSLSVSRLEEWSEAFGLSEDRNAPSRLAHPGH